MSGIAGMLRFDSQAADPAIVAAMTEAARHRGPDAGGCWTAGAVGLGLRLLQSTPESLGEEGPFHDRENELCLVLDGRVDNREELAQALRAAGCPPRGSTDAELVMRAWQVWREDAPRRILGDFAFALWDGRAKALFCARDILGVRPFHYVAGPHRFLFASELQQLFRDPSVPETLNEGMIGEYLAFAIASAEDTFFAAVRRLPPAHWMRVGEDGQVRVRRYWDVDFSVEIRHPREEDYVRQLSELLETSVRCRLRRSGPAGFELSGGMDSSTVCLLAHKISDGNRGAGMHAFSVTYPGLACDESTHIEAAARHAGIDPVLLPNREAGAAEFERQAARYRDFAGYPVPNSFFGTIAPAAAQRGCRLLFSGAGGDEWFSGEADGLADALVDLPRLRREAEWVAAWQEIPLSRAILRHAAKPWLRRAARATGLLRLRQAQMPWLRSDWAARTNLVERIRRRQAQPPGGSCTQVAKHAWTFNAHATHDYEMSDRLSYSAGIEYRHPLLDRRLIEFAFATPPSLHFAGGRSKSLLRRALQGLLPTAVLEAPGKVDFSILNCRALDRVLAERPAASWFAARAGWVDPAVLAADYAGARAALMAGANYPGHVIWRTWMAHAVGVTIEALQAPRARVI